MPPQELDQQAGCASCCSFGGLVTLVLSGWVRVRASECLCESRCESCDLHPSAVQGPSATSSVSPPRHVLRVSLAPRGVGGAAAGLPSSPPTARGTLRSRRELLEDSSTIVAGDAAPPEIGADRRVSRDSGPRACAPVPSLPARRSGSQRRGAARCTLGLVLARTPRAPRRMLELGDRELAPRRELAARLRRRSPACRPAQDAWDGASSSTASCDSCVGFRLGSRVRDGRRKQPRGDDLVGPGAAWSWARIAWQTSGCSRRNAVALWRPWPSRSSPNEKYEPDFWTTLCSSAGVEHRALPGDAGAEVDVELRLLERRRDLVLHDLDAHAVADRLDAFLQRLDAADVEAHRRVELQRAAARGRLGVAEHDADLLAQLVREDRRRCRCG